MPTLPDTLKALIPDDWKNDPSYENVKYVEYHWVGRKHCDEAVSYRDVSRATVWKCRHENPNYKAKEDERTDV